MQALHANCKVDENSRSCLEILLHRLPMLSRCFGGATKRNVRLIRLACIGGNDSSSSNDSYIASLSPITRNGWEDAVLSSRRSLLKCTRSFSSTLIPDKNATVAKANSILQRIDAAHFREVLEQESQVRWNMEYSDFVALCISSGAASSEEEAVDICDALDRSGVVLRVKNLVYLRPLEVAEIIYQALPDTDREVRSRLDQLRKEIAPLMEQKQSIDSHARRVSRIVLWGGLAAMVGQWLLFARLTFWELSWDVMEPVTYFTGAALGIAAYTYCIWYNEEFGYHRARERIHASVADKTYARKGFDKGRFDYLLQRIHRLESSLAAIVPLKNGSQAAQSMQTS